MSRVAADAHYELSLVELLRGFMECAHSLGKTSFPPFESPLWHIFLWELKEKHRIELFPNLECIEPFDWDGPEPKCREFDVAMFGLRRVCFSKTVGGRIYLNTEEIRQENPLIKYFSNLAHVAITLAESMPEFFEPR